MVLFMIEMRSKIDTFKKLRILIIVVFIFILFSYIIPLIAVFANETENLDNTVTHLNSTNTATINNIGAGNLTIEVVSQLLLATFLYLLFGFKALFVLLFLQFLNCWTASITLKTPNQHGIIIIIVGLLGILGTLLAAILTQRLHYRYTIELQKRERFGNKQLEAYQSLWKVLSSIESKFGISKEECHEVDSLSGLVREVDDARKNLSAVIDEGLPFYYPQDTLALIKQMQEILESPQAKTVKDLCECVKKLKKELEKERIK